MGHESPRTASSKVRSSVKTVMPSPASTGPSNAMNVFVLTLKMLDNLSNAMNVFVLIRVMLGKLYNAMNVFAMMAGIPLA